MQTTEQDDNRKDETTTKVAQKEKSESEEVPFYLKPRHLQTNDEIRRDIARLRDFKILPLPDDPELISDPILKQQAEDRRRLQAEIRKLEGNKLVPEEPLGVRQWKVDDQDNIENFQVTDARLDILYRLKHNQLYTFSECEVIVKEVVRAQQREAAKDVRNLMFLDSFRSDFCFPLPAKREYLGVNNCIDGFNDSESLKRLLKDELQEVPESELQSQFQREQMSKDKSEISSTSTPTTMIPILKPKMKLHKLLRKVNQGIVTLIDNGLRQRKERLLLAATILEELENSKVMEEYRYDLLIIKAQQISTKKKKNGSKPIEEVIQP